MGSFDTYVVSTEGRGGDGEREREREREEETQKRERAREEGCCGYCMNDTVSFN